MFVFDTLSEIPKKIEIEKLYFLIHDVKKDSLAQRMNFIEYKNFINLNNIHKDDDLSLRKYR